MTDAPCTISTLRLYKRFEQMRVNRGDNKGETAFDWCLGRHVYLQVDTAWYQVFAAGTLDYTASTHLQQKRKGNLSLHKEIKVYRTYLTLRQRRAHVLHNWKHGSYYTVTKKLLWDHPSFCIWKQQVKVRLYMQSFCTFQMQLKRFALQSRKG
jgi:hypothetical protein